MITTSPQNLVTNGLAIAGGVYGLLSALAGTLPSSWGFTRFCARFAADLRGILAAVEQTPLQKTRITFTGDK